MRSRTSIPLSFGNSSLGADLEYLISIDNGNIRPFAKVEYGANISDDSDVTRSIVDNASTITANLNKRAEQNYKIKLGAEVVTKDDWIALISYERNQAEAHGYSESLSFGADLKF